MIDNCSSLEETQKQYLLFCDMCSESYRYLTIDWDKKYEINDSALDEYLQTCADKKFTNENGIYEISREQIHQLVLKDFEEDLDYTQSK